MAVSVSGGFDPATLWRTVTGIYCHVGWGYPPGMCAASSLEPLPDKPPQPRRRIPLSLRMFGATLAAVSIGGAVTIALPLRRQHQTLMELNRSGISIGMERQVPTWLRDVIGDERADFFELIDSVQFNPHNVTVDADIECLNGLPGLRSLTVIGAPMTDAGFQRAGLLNTLGFLWLEDVNVSDAGFQQVRNLTNLEELRLNRTAVTDAGLAHLTGVTKLRELSIENMPVTDGGLAYLKKLTGLKILRLTNTRATGRGIADLERALPGLTIEK